MRIENFRILKFSNNDAHIINFNKIKYIDLDFETNTIPIMSGDLDNLKETGNFYLELQSYLKIHLDNEILTFIHFKIIKDKKNYCIDYNDNNLVELEEIKVIIKHNLLKNKCNLLAKFLSDIQNSYPTNIINMNQFTIEIEKILEPYNIYAEYKDIDNNSFYNSLEWDKISYADYKNKVNKIREKDIYILK